MMDALNRFVGNRVLGWFLLHPTTRRSINELARELGVSPGSVKHYADVFEDGGIITSTSAGTARILALNNEHVLVRELKRVCMVLMLREAGILELSPGSISVALYGSMAKGSFDERSDVDILVIGTENDVDYERVPAIEARLEHELQVTVLPYYRWEEMKKEEHSFAKSVLENHILFSGAEL